MTTCDIRRLNRCIHKVAWGGGGAEQSEGTGKVWGMWGNDIHQDQKAYTSSKLFSCTNLEIQFTGKLLIPKVNVQGCVCEGMTHCESVNLKIETWNARNIVEKSWNMKNWQKDMELNDYSWNLTKFCHQILRFLCIFCRHYKN